MWAGLLTAIVLIPVVVLNWRCFPVSLALIWGFALFLFVFFEQVIALCARSCRAGQNGGPGVYWRVGVVVYGSTIGDWSTGAIVGWSLAILLVALVLGFDLDGASPLQAGATVAYYARRWPGIMKLWALIGYDLEMPFVLSVDTELCRGCKTCVEVCPKAVYELYAWTAGRSRRLRVQKIACSALHVSSSVRKVAILSRPPIKVFEPMEV